MVIPMMVEQLGLAIGALRLDLQPGVALPARQAWRMWRSKNFDIINSPLNQLQYSPYVQRHSLFLHD